MRIWSHLLKKSLMENFIFCALLVTNIESFICLSKAAIIDSLSSRFLKDDVEILISPISKLNPAPKVVKSTN